MIITFDSECNRAYIYLQNLYKNYFSRKSVYIRNIEIMKNNLKINRDISKLSVTNTTYRRGLKEGIIDCEYDNDLDKYGYLKGIELSINKKELSSLIDNITAYEINWREDMYMLYALDSYEKVFDERNIIYPLRNKKDAFVIIQKEEVTNIGYIKGLIHANEKIYPVKYLNNIEVY